MFCNFGSITVMDWPWEVSPAIQKLSSGSGIGHVFGEIVGFTSRVEKYCTDIGIALHPPMFFNKSKLFNTIYMLYYPCNSMVGGIKKILFSTLTSLAVLFPKIYVCVHFNCTYNNPRPFSLLSIPFISIEFNYYFLTQVLTASLTPQGFSTAIQCPQAAINLSWPKRYLWPSGALQLSLNYFLRNIYA